MFPCSPPVGTDLLVWIERTAMQALLNRVSRNCKHWPVRCSGSDTHTPTRTPSPDTHLSPGAASHAPGACSRPLCPGTLYLCTCRSAAWRPGRRVTWLLLCVWRCSFLFFLLLLCARVYVDIDIFFKFFYSLNWGNAASPQVFASPGLKTLDSWLFTAGLSVDLS